MCDDDKLGGLEVCTICVMMISLDVWRLTSLHVVCYDDKFGGLEVYTLCDDGKFGSLHVVCDDDKFGSLQVYKFTCCV